MDSELHSLDEVSRPSVSRPDRPVVVLFAAPPHGGANISSIVLGQHPDVFPTGELRNFPVGRQFLDERICTCKVVSTACPFWRRVLSRFHVTKEVVDAERIAALYRIIAKESGRPIIADVAQDPDWAEWLSRNPRLDLRLVHVHREGAAIINAVLRHRSEGLRYAGWSRLRKTAKATRRWKRHVARLTKLEAELGPRAIAIDYERLCLDPVETLGRLSAFLSLDLAPIADRLHRGQPMANAPHLLRGGTKFAKLEQITLRLDDRFRRQMSASEKLMHWAARVIP